MASFAEQEASLRAQLAALQERRLPPVVLQTPQPPMAVEPSLPMQATAYDPDERTVTILR